MCVLHGCRFEVILQSLLHGRERFSTFPLQIYSASGVSCAGFHTQSPEILPTLLLLLKFPKQQQQDLETVISLWIAAGRQRAWLHSPLQGHKLGMLSLSCNLNKIASLVSCTQGDNWVQKDEQKEAGGTEGRGGSPSLQLLPGLLSAAGSSWCRICIFCWGIIGWIASIGLIYYT